jgi:hypothetical protein
MGELQAPEFADPCAAQHAINVSSSAPHQLEGIGVMAHQPAVGRINALTA